MSDPHQQQTSQFIGMISSLLVAFAALASLVRKNAPKAPVCRLQLLVSTQTSEALGISAETSAARALKSRMPISNVNFLPHFPTLARNNSAERAR
jgi:hypothetical protein